MDGVGLQMGAGVVGRWLEQEREALGEEWSEWTDSEEGVTE